MRRGRSALLAASLVCLGCGRSDRVPETETVATIAASAASAPAAPHPRLAPRAPRALTAPRLPEDPVVAARTSARTDERRAKKKHARYLAFDRETMPVHRALLARLGSARARYDRARSEAALKAARAALPAQLEEIKRSLVKLDAKSVGSRLLADYEALLAELASSYPEAKLAALRGDASALAAAQASFDGRLHAMREWLEEAEATASPSL